VIESDHHTADRNVRRKPANLPTRVNKRAGAASPHAGDKRHAPRHLGWRDDVCKRIELPCKTALHIVHDSDDSELTALTSSEGGAYRVLAGKQRTRCRLRQNCYIAAGDIR
jgi:hypothetical protein